jgi:hypothetical protein
MCDSHLLHILEPWRLVYKVYVHLPAAFCMCTAVCLLLQYDLDDNGKLDSKEFVKMVATLGADVSRTEAEAAMEVRRLTCNSVSNMYTHNM